jgi:hypothetical protein
MEISEFYSKYLDRASLFIFKVPLNYKISNFENAGISLMNVKKEEFILGDKPMYLFLIINGNPLMRTENKQTEDESYLFGGTKTNGINFLNSSLEQLFNSLSSDNQIKIKSLNDDNEINKVLTMIHNKITQGNEFKGGTELETNFNILPEHIKYGALGKAYEQMAGEFKETSEELEGESIKTKLPEKDNIPEEFKIKEITDSSSININNDESKNENQSETKNVSFG